MPLLFNIRHLENKDLHLKGDLPVEELELEGLDELIHFSEPLKYDLEIQKSGNGVLVQGKLQLDFECECARCLKRFKNQILLDDWAVHLALSGDEKVGIDNDRIDLTPFFREDILLEFPQHPLCKPECRGLPRAPSPSENDSGRPGQNEMNSSWWSELNKLKFKK